MPATVAASPRPYNAANAYGLAGPASSVVYDARGNRQGGYGNPYGPTITRPNPRLTNQVLELLRAASAAGPVHFLPFHGLTGETPEIRRSYRDMLRNPYLKGAVFTVALQVCSLPYQVQPCKWGGPFAEESAANIDYSLECVEGGFAQMAFDLLIGGIKQGHSLNEKVFRTADYGPESGRVVLDALKAKDDLTYRLDVDRFLNVTAVQATAFNYGEFYNPDDFVLFTHNKIYNNPLGMSDFRSVWAAVQRFDMITRLELIGLDKFALPFLTATYSSAEHFASLEAALSTARDNGYLLVPQGVEVQILNLLSAKSQDAFQKSKEDCAKEIVVGISGAYLHMLTSGTKDDRGSASVQKSTTELIPWWLSQQVCNALNKQWVPQQSRWNFGLDVGLPRITVGGVNVSELLNDLQLDEGLLGLGVDLSVEDRRAYYGRTAPTDPRDSLLARKALVSMLGQPPPNGGGPGGPGGAGPGGGGGGKPGGGSPAGGDGNDTGLTFADDDLDDPLSFAGDYYEGKFHRGQPGNKGQFGPGGGGAATTKRRWPNQPLQRTPTNQPYPKQPPARPQPASMGGPAAQPQQIADALAMLESHFGKGAVSVVDPNAPATPKAKAPAAATAPKPRDQQLRELVDQTQRDLKRLEGSSDQEASFDRAVLKHQLDAAQAELAGQPVPPALGEPTPAPPPSPHELQAAGEAMARAAEDLTKLKRQLKAAGVSPGHGEAFAAAADRLTRAGAAYGELLSRMKAPALEPLPFGDAWESQPRDDVGRWAALGARIAEHVERHRQTVAGLLAEARALPRAEDAKAAAHQEWETKKAILVPQIKEKNYPSAEFRRQLYELNRQRHFEAAAEAHNTHRAAVREKVQEGIRAAHHELQTSIKRELSKLAAGLPPKQARALALAMRSAAGAVVDSARLQFADDLLEFAGTYEESKHPRGQPKNKGQFGHSPGGGASGGEGKGGAGSPPANPADHPALQALMDAEFGGREKKATAGEQPAPAKVKKKFTKSKAKVKLSDLADPDRVEELRESLIGYQSLDDLPSLVGAPDDAEVTVVQGSKDTLWINVKHEAYTAKRYLKADKEGRVLMHNDEFWMKPEFQKSGLGTEIFARQVQFCRDAGLDYIECHAAKENGRNAAKPHNGYYTWPRLGYDMSLTDEDGIHDSDVSVYAAARKAFPDAETVLDVMETKEGRDWWKANGTDMLEAKFDLSEDSRSTRVMEAYLNEREEAKRATMNFSDPAAGDAPTGEEEIVLNDDEESALERAWERLSEEDAAE